MQSRHTEFHSACAEARTTATVLQSRAAPACRPHPAGSYTTGPLLFGTPRSLRPTAGAGIRALARAGVPGGSAWDAAAAPSAAGSWRPGSMAGAPSMAGSVAGSQGPVLPGFLAELGEDENLRRISAAMLAEWFRCGGGWCGGIQIGDVSGCMTVVM